MGRNKLKIVSLLAILVFSLFYHAPATGGGTAEESVSPVAGGGEGMAAVRKRCHPIVEAAMRLFSLPTTFPYTPASYWAKLDSLVRNGLGFFSTAPNLDFRASGKAGIGEEEGNGKKLVEEVIMKSKETVEDSAKSAARLAAEAVGSLKKTMSSKKTEEKGEEL
ncbi:unnamed protein product [Cuscuta epithymum]|uniref:Uncharacterized protein n=1 Tax=Cuscuta epithymum TaxID=186058 RepID=A0AAV0F3Q9_9ASTE|nr:unnamed protein product [Cuscuta epithymum]CAH9130118.1 unnamed protein product [Cuscuta epithymum]